jgi:imidazolonepropionase-like amidohydrolase
MGALKEQWLADVEAEDMLARAYAWEDEQKFERSLHLYEQVKNCADLSDTLMLHATVEQVPARMMAIVDRLQRELALATEQAREIL